MATVRQRPTDFVPQLAANIEAPDEMQHRAFELARVTEETAIANGCRPSSVAAACLYRVAKTDGWVVTKSTVADATNATSSTVQTHGTVLVAALED